jgi:hypothetical protein
VQAAAEVPDGGSPRIEAQGHSIEGDEVAETVMPPALVVPGLIVWLQRRRSPSLAPATATAGGA